MKRCAGLSALAAAGILGAGLMAAWPASAAKVGQGPRPEAYEALVKCRAIQEDAARLACFDKASAALEAATERNDVVLVDRKAIHETKTSIFGLNLPKLAIFGGHDDEEISSIEGVVDGARQDQEGRWILRLQDGATWHQLDDHVLGREPKHGSAVKISKASMGSYMMNVEKQPGIRVRREN